MDKEKLITAVRSICLGAVILAGINLFSGLSARADIIKPADSTPELHLEPARSYIKPGEQCTLSVMVDDSVDSLSCVFCVLTFDPQIVDCITAQEGELYLNSSYSTFFNWELIAPDSLRLEDCVMGYRSFILTPGELYTVVFEGIQTGNCPVRIEDTEVYDIDRVEFPAETGSGASISVSITAGDESRAPSYGSFNCYPNPFNPSATITFCPAAGETGVYPARGELMIYSPSGGLVRTLFQGRLKKGKNDFCWNGRNERGNPVSSGVYMAVLRTPASTYIQKMILVK